MKKRALAILTLVFVLTLSLALPVLAAEGDTVAYFKLDEGAGTDLTDSSGNGVLAYIENANDDSVWDEAGGEGVYLNKDVPNVTTMDGNKRAQHILLVNNDSILAPDSFTLEAVIKFDEPTGQVDTIGVFNRDYVYSLFIYLAGTDGKAHFLVDFCSGDIKWGGAPKIDAVTDKGMLFDGAFHNLALSYDVEASCLTVLWDGEILASKSFDGVFPPNTNNEDIIVGSRFWYNQTHFASNCIVKAIRFSSAALPGDELLDVNGEIPQIEPEPEPETETVSETAVTEISNEIETDAEGKPLDIMALLPYVLIFAAVLILVVGVIVIIVLLKKKPEEKKD